MSTLADLQTRIMTETNRDDLGDVLLGQMQRSIADAIAEYQDERFWFNELRVTGTLAAGQQYAPLPSGALAIDRLSLLVGGVAFEIFRRSMAHIEALYAVPLTGQPMEYAVYAGQARLWPTPVTAYPSVWLTISKVMPEIGFPNPDVTISNAWTNEAQWLIRARAKEFLYRHVFKDPDAAAAAAQDRAEAYAKVKGYSNTSLATGRLVPSW
ncbi:MAG TPA: hypothetical protein VE309_11535 [Caulobacteraceae bacterium]|nr:hypothetical protein [Caulobacteraceae bacterium]